MSTSRVLKIIMLVLTLAGLGIAAYVTYVHYAGIKPACTLGESCTKVQTSKYAELAGVPVALIGLIGYVVILVTLLLPDSETTRFAAVALTLGGFGFSAYLTYREIYSIKAICEECATSAVMMTILMLLAIWRFLRGSEPQDAPASATQSALSEQTPSLGTAP